MMNLNIKTLHLPTLPGVLARLQALMRDPDVGINDLANVIAEDPPLAARALRVANSSFYGLEEPARTIERAATILGTKVLHNLVLQASVMEQFKYRGSMGHEVLDTEWRHAVLTAQLCQVIAQRSPVRQPLSPEESYTCGLLHDIGKMVLLENLGDPYAELLERAFRNREPLEALEQGELGHTHAQASAILVHRWGLDRETARALRLHHGPTYCARWMPTVAVLVLADHLSNELLNLPSPKAEQRAAWEFAPNTLSLPPGTIDEIRKAARQAMMAEP